MTRTMTNRISGRKGKMPESYRAFVLVLFVLGLTALVASAETRYVATGGNNTPPYTTWATAATNIAEAGLWAVVTDGDVIVLTNETHHVLEDVLVNNDITITGLQAGAGAILNGDGGAYNCFRGSVAKTRRLSGLIITNFGTTAISARMGEWWIRDCVISGNSGNNGGAVAPNGNSRLYLEDCLLAGNTAANWGGALFVQKGGDVLCATNCVMQDNSAGGSPYSGGAAFFYSNAGEGSTGEFYKCEFIDNNATGNGGAIYSMSYHVTVRDCTMKGNTASSGGAMALYPNDMVENCTVVSNRASSYGGGIYMSSGTVRNSRLSHNISGSTGGGAYLSGSAIIRNCLLSHNVSSNRGGGVHLFGTMDNCTVVSNTGKGAGGVWGDTAALANSIVYYNLKVSWAGPNYDGTIGWTNCCTTPDPGAGAIDCITDDPVFTSVASDNFRPVPDSPCVNAGLNASWMQGAKDLDNYTRVSQDIVDMGAYEYHPAGTIMIFR